VTQGFAADENVVTVGVTSGDQGALESLCREVIKKTRLFNFPAIGPEADKIMVTVLLSPPVAQSLADAGYSSADVKRYVYEHATMRLEEYDWVLRYTATMRTSAKEWVDAGLLPQAFAGAPDSKVRVLSSPDLLHIIVCGDPHRNRIMVMEGGHTQPTTKSVRLPENWVELLKNQAACTFTA
jgi:hypothetical protein